MKFASISVVFAVMLLFTSCTQNEEIAHPDIPFVFVDYIPEFPIPAEATLVSSHTYILSKTDIMSQPHYDEVGSCFDDVGEGDISCELYFYDFDWNIEPKDELNHIMQVPYVNRFLDEIENPANHWEMWEPNNGLPIDVPGKGYNKDDIWLTIEFVSSSGFMIKVYRAYDGA